MRNLIYPISFIFLDTDNELDIIFGIGASGRDAPQVFQLEKEIVKRVIDLPKTVKTRYAVLDYHNGSRTLVGFDDFKDEEKLKNYIDALSRTGNADSLQSLLMNAMDVFKENTKSRKVFVVFVNDRQSADLRDLRNMANMLNERGVKIIVVTIGDRVSNQEIDSIASTSDTIIRVKISDDVIGIGDRTGTEMLKGNVSLFCKNYWVCVCCTCLSPL